MNTKAITMFFAVFLIIATACGAFAQATSTVIENPKPVSGTIISGPAINIPYGGKIKAEMYFTNKDLIKLLKEFIMMSPDFIDIAIPFMGMDVSPEQCERTHNMIQEIKSKIDTKPLAAAIENLEAVRVIVAEYPQSIKSETISKQFEKGLAKTGTFRKTFNVLDYEAVSLYMEEGDKGCVLLFNSGWGEFTAVRVVGSVDVIGIMKWGINTYKVIMPYFIAMRTPAPEPEPMPEDATPEALPEPEPAK